VAIPGEKQGAGAAGQRQEAGAAPTFAGFAVRLFAYLFLVSLLFSLGSLHLRLRPVQEAMAATVTVGANLLGATAQVRGSVVDVGQSAIEINHECTGVFVLVVYGVFILAYPAAWSQRLRGIAVGAVILTAVNIARLILLAFVASARPSWVDYLHEYFFQILFIALLAFMASAWTERVRLASRGDASG